MPKIFKQLIATLNTINKEKITICQQGIKIDKVDKTYVYGDLKMI